MKKYICYGAGSFFYNHKDEFNKFSSEGGEIVAFCYTDEKYIYKEIKSITNGKPIIFLSDLKFLEYDFILVCATGCSSFEITVSLLRNNIKLNKIKWLFLKQSPMVIPFVNAQIESSEGQDNILNNIVLESFISLINIQNNLVEVKNNMNRLEKRIKTVDDYLTKKFYNETFIYNVSIHGIDFKFQDSLLSFAVPSIAKELNNTDEYDFSKLKFTEGDCVVDIGGNVGMVSIFLAKIFPFLKIYAFEPFRQNYLNFLKNIELNGIRKDQIKLFNMAVTKDGRSVNMDFDVHNTGGTSLSDVIVAGANKQHFSHEIQSITLTKIFEYCNIIGNLKLLKIDCEGSEYEIIYNTPDSILKRIDILRGEFHESKFSRQTNDSMKLLAYCKERINNVKVTILKK